MTGTRAEMVHALVLEAQRIYPRPLCSEGLIETRYAGDLDTDHERKPQKGLFSPILGLPRPGSYRLSGESGS